MSHCQNSSRMPRHFIDCPRHYQAVHVSHSLICLTFVDCHSRASWKRRCWRQPGVRFGVVWCSEAVARSPWEEMRLLKLREILHFRSADTFVASDVLISFSVSVRSSPASVSLHLAFVYWFHLFIPASASVLGVFLFSCLHNRYIGTRSKLKRWAVCVARSCQGDLAKPLLLFGGLFGECPVPFGNEHRWTSLLIRHGNVVGVLL